MMRESISDMNELGRMVKKSLIIRKHFKKARMADVEQKFDCR